MRAKTFAPLAATVAAIVLVTGCSRTSEGQANAESESGRSATVAAQGAAPGEMDPGTYRTTPQADFGTVTSVNSGRYVEGQRMAEFVVLPTELDPLLTGPVGMSTYVIKSGTALSVLLTGKSPDIAEREGMLTGFSTSRSYEDKKADKSIVHAVLRFPDAESAQRAAADMSADDALPSEYLPGGVPTSIDILPDTLTTTRESSDGTFSSNSFTPHGQYIIYTWASAPIAEKDWTAQITAKALEQQGPMIDKFPATAADKFAELPMDIDNVLVLTIPEDDGNRTTSSDAVYGPRGSAHVREAMSIDLKALTAQRRCSICSKETSSTPKDSLHPPTRPVPRTWPASPRTVRKERTTTASSTKGGTSVKSVLSTTRRRSTR